MRDRNNEPEPTLHQTQTGRTDDYGFCVRRTFAAPAPRVYRAWAQADLFQRWWMPRSIAGVALVACEMDVRSGGNYALAFAAEGAEPMRFFGDYIDVEPNVRMVWTNDEGDAGAITTVTFTDAGDQTLLTFSERHRSRQACDEALEGSAAGLPEQFTQLDALLASGLA